MLFIKTVSLEFVLFLFVVVHCKDPPVLIGSFKPLYTVKEGQNVRLRCKFSGADDSAHNRTLTAWQKLPEGHYFTDKYERFKMRNGRYLRIKKVTFEDQGTYLCIAYNPFGKVKKEIRLVVQASNSSSIRTPAPRPTSRKPIPSTSSTSVYARDPKRPCNIRPSKIPLIDDSPPKFKNPSRNRNRFLEYVEGHELKLKCHAYGAPPLNVTWLKKGKPLSSRARQTHVKSSGFVLRFAALTLNDGGTYTCIVRNSYCRIQRIFHVKVVGAPLPKERKPRILENVFKNETAMSGEDVTFVCSAVSKSRPEFHFLKWKSPKNVSNGSDPFEFVDFSKSKFREIREIAKQNIGQGQVYTHRLIVKNVTMADEAKYTCAVGNSAGYVSSHAYLTVVSQEGYLSDQPQGGGLGEQSTVTKATKITPRPQANREILVEEVPLAALIGVPIAVLILLIGTIVWCYFMTRKHHVLQLKKDSEKDLPPQEEVKDLSPQFYPPKKEETRNVSFNVYVDYPNERSKTCLTTEQQSQTHVKCASPRVKCDSTHVKCDSSHGKSAIDPPLDGLIINNEPQRTHSNRTDHRKRHEREELEFNESIGPEIKCSGV